MSNSNTKERNDAQRKTDALQSRIAELEHNEERLRESEQRFHNMYEHTSIGIAEVDMDFTIRAANPAYCRMLGFKEEELRGIAIPEITHPDDRPENNEKLAQLAQGEIPMVQMEKRFLHKQGHIVHGLLNATAVFDENGNPKYLLGNLLDITDYKRSENEIKKAEKKYRVLFNSIRDAILVANTDREIIDCNQAFTDLFGYSLNEIEHKPTGYVYADSEEFQEMGTELRKHIGDPKFRMVIRYRKKTGEVFPGETSAFYLTESDGEIAGFIGLIRDISREREQQKALEKSEHKYREIFQNTHDALFLQEFSNEPLQQSFLEVNAAAEELLGYSQEELLEVPPVDFVNMPEEQARQIREEYREHGTVTFETTVITKDGTEIPVEMRDHHFTLDSVPVVLTVARDITRRKTAEEERKQYEAQLRQAQKMEAIGRLAGGIAHDFNNKLTIILGQADFALQVDEPDQTAKSLCTIKETAKDSAQLTKQLLGFARKQTISPQILDLNETVSGMLSMLKRLIGENIDLNWIPGDDLWPVILDPVQIDQILANLLVNARDAIDDVGKVTIETANVSIDKEYCRTHAGFTPGDFAMLAVSDNGCGMDEETLTEIFEPFYTTKPEGEGTGLGLSTVYGIVKQNDGFINVYSEPGAGTMFKIYIPRTEGKTESVTFKEKTGTAPGGSETILIVEDDSELLNLTRITLEGYGYTVLSANSVDEALRLARENQESIRLLLTDVVMPEMNGSELASQIISFSPEIRVLFMSGYTENVIVHQGILKKQVEFIQKPYSPASLGTKVREVLDQ